jgi:hypothetical protein
MRGHATAALAHAHGPDRPVPAFVLLVTPWLRPEFRKARRPAVLAALLLPSSPSRAAGSRATRPSPARRAQYDRGHQPFYYRAAGALSRERGASRIEDTRAELEREMSRRVRGRAAAERSRFETARAFEILAAHPRGALLEAGSGAVRLLRLTPVTTALAGLNRPGEPSGRGRQAPSG